MTTNKDHSKDDTVPKGHWVNTVFKPVSYVASLVAGVGTTRFLVNEEAFEDMKKHGAFEDILSTYKKNLDQASDEAIIRAKEKKGFTKVFQRALTTERRNAHGLVEERMKTLELNSFVDQWMALQGKERFTSAVWGLTISGVLLGATMDISHELEKHYKDKEEQGR